MRGGFPLWDAGENSGEVREAPASAHRAEAHDAERRPEAAPQTPPHLRREAERGAEKDGRDIRRREAHEVGSRLREGVAAKRPCDTERVPSTITPQVLHKLTLAGFRCSDADGAGTSRRPGRSLTCLLHNL